MRTGILSIVISATMMMSACAQQKKTVSGNSIVKTKQPAIQVLAMERTACFGTCPAYRIELHSDGKAVYTGRHYTEYQGVYETHFSTAKVQALFSQFAKHRVDTCKEEYKSMIQDLPGVDYYITYADKKEQSIINAHFGPDFLPQLAAEVDSFSKVDGTWKKVAEPEKH